MICSRCGTNNPDGSAFCARCGAPLTQGIPTMQYQPAVQTPMKWYKFLIYFSLFAGAVLNAISGIIALTGAQYDGMAELVYAVFGGLKVVDILMGLACLAVAAFGIYVRFRLAQFRADGPKKLMMLYIVSCLLNILYLIAVVVVLPGEMSGDIILEELPRAIGTIVGSAVMVFVNKVYFDKRAHMFNQ